MATRKQTKTPVRRTAKKAAVRKPTARTAKKSAPTKKAAPAKQPAARRTTRAPRVAERRHQPENLRLRELSAGFTVNDLERSMRFYIEALGFTVKERWERDGKLNGVMLVAGTCELALGQDDWAKGRHRAKGAGFRLYAATAQDLTAIAARIRAHGAAAEGPLVAPWGARIVSVTDPDGFQITIFQED